MNFFKSLFQASVSHPGWRSLGAGLGHHLRAQLGSGSEDAQSQKKPPVIPPPPRMAPRLWRLSPGSALQLCRP